MPTLREVASVVKSANAGASWLTFDLAFPDAETLATVLDAGVLTPERLGARLKVEPAKVRVFVMEALIAVKISVPRRDPRCGQTERDFDGVQQFVPLLDMEWTA